MIGPSSQWIIVELRADHEDFQRAVAFGGEGRDLGKVLRRRVGQHRVEDVVHARVTRCGGAVACERLGKCLTGPLERHVADRRDSAGDRRQRAGVEVVDPELGVRCRTVRL
jgi:hypothetical protein